MQRAPEALTGRRFDLLVVGGGIHGLFAAYDAAARGLSVALVERDDFGSGLSFNHQRTIHGGLRALQHGNLQKTHRQIVERRTWARIAPHLIRPLPFLIGTYGQGTRSRLALRAAFAVYDRVGRSRNHQVPAELHLPACRLESRTTTRRLFRGIREQGLTGGGIWYDYQTRHPDRLTWTVALGAEAAGARLVNYVEAVGPRRQGDRVTGAEVRDVLTGQSFDVEASVTMLAAGSAAPSVMRAFGAAGAPPLLRAMNVLIDRPARDIALASKSARGRMLTAVPWRGQVLVGTDQSDGPVEESDRRPPAAAVEAFLDDLNSAFPELQARVSDVRFVHHGLTPGVGRHGGFDLLPEAIVTRHDTPGTRGLVTVIGVKYTTARAVAEQAVDAAVRMLDKRARACRTATAILPHADIADVEGRMIETLRRVGMTLDADVQEHLAGWYGTEAPAVIEHAARRGEMARLSPSRPVLSAEVSYAVETASAVRLADVALRRTPLGSAAHPGRAALEAAAAIMARMLGWSAARQEDEVTSVEAVYPALTGP